MMQDTKQDTARQVEGKALLEQVMSIAKPKETKIIRFLVDEFALHEAARFLEIPRSAAISCMENFYCRAKTALG